ncbi:hypothetical protein OOT46_25705 [Aquabacterium sp. A7-Y]|nr:hypothetical protein [Aquabacterium sp. A7-Y]MCW7541210.1 hypothetical protein [Aquabacterium sp. A7-Y]
MRLPVDNLSFFDPNTGALSSPRANVLANCLEAYFRTEKIRNAYRTEP